MRDSQSSPGLYVDVLVAKVYLVGGGMHPDFNTPGANDVVTRFSCVVFKTNRELLETLVSLSEESASLGFGTAYVLPAKGLPTKDASDVLRGHLRVQLPIGVTATRSKGGDQVPRAGSRRATSSRSVMPSCSLGMPYGEKTPLPAPSLTEVLAASCSRPTGCFWRLS